MSKMKVNKRFLTAGILVMTIAAIGLFVFTTTPPLSSFDIPSGGKVTLIVNRHICQDDPEGYYEFIVEWQDLPTADGQGNYLSYIGVCVGPPDQEMCFDVYGFTLGEYSSRYSKPSSSVVYIGQIDESVWGGIVPAEDLRFKAYILLTDQGVFTTDWVNQGIVNHYESEVVIFAQHHVYDNQSNHYSIIIKGYDMKVTSFASGEPRYADLLTVTAIGATKDIEAFSLTAIDEKELREFRDFGYSCTISESYFEETGGILSFKLVVYSDAGNLEAEIEPTRIVYEDKRTQAGNGFELSLVAISLVIMFILKKKKKNYR